MSRDLATRRLESVCVWHRSAPINPAHPNSGWIYAWQRTALLLVMAMLFDIVSVYLCVYSNTTSTDDALQ